MVIHAPVSSFLRRGSSQHSSWNCRKDRQAGHQPPTEPIFTELCSVPGTGLGPGVGAARTSLCPPGTDIAEGKWATGKGVDKYVRRQVLQGETRKDKIEWEAGGFCFTWAVGEGFSKVTLHSKWERNKGRAPWKTLERVFQTEGTAVQKP